MYILIYMDIYTNRFMFGEFYTENYRKFFSTLLNESVSP